MLGIATQENPGARLADFTGPTPTAAVPGTFGPSCNSQFSIIVSSGDAPAAQVSISGLISQTEMDNAHDNLMQPDAVHLSNGCVYRRETYRGGALSSFVDILRNGEFYKVNSTVGTYGDSTSTPFINFPVDQAAAFCK